MPAVTLRRTEIVRLNLMTNRASHAVTRKRIRVEHFKRVILDAVVVRLREARGYVANRAAVLNQVAVLRERGELRRDLGPP